MRSSVTPDRALDRVLRISRLNGWSVAVFAALCTLLTLLLGDRIGILVGGLVVASGLMEVRGNRLLHQRHAEGMRWLVHAQLLLLGVILVYAFVRILTLDRDLGMANLTPVLREALTLLEIHPEDFLPLVRTTARAFYAAVMVAAGLYQGGLACYYIRRKPLVEQALAAPPVLLAAD